MSTAESDQEYQVLARKYRPGNFAELVGQEALVRTLSNAVESGRVAHAFILTGVRGIGKTTTARIIARVLNCVGADGQGGPTVDPCGVCEHCLAIAESRHMDVLEMDAASRTGVDDVREIIDSVRYAPGSARYKIYIIDEVHMLTRNAFNALLKTLEEPPEHVIFIFATTEVRRVPVTVLSRCQRFDLRRVEGAVLGDYLSDLAGREGIEVEPGAIAALVRAAEGSVRDGLSLLDQAIAHGGGKVSEQMLRDMLGLADRARILDMFDALMSGEIKAALDQLGEQYDSGADPIVVIQDLLELSHALTRLKVVPDGGEDLGLAEDQRSRARDMAAKLSMATLTRAWSMLLKGLGQARGAPSAMAAAEMLLVRLAYAAELPTPADMVRRLEESGDTAPSPSPSKGSSGPAGNGARAVATPGQASMAPDTLAASPAAEPEAQAIAPRTQIISNFEAAVQLFNEKREGRLYVNLMQDVAPVAFEPGRIELSPGPNAPPDLAARASAKLGEWTGERWIVTMTQSEGGQSLADREAAAREAERDAALSDPLVQQVLKTFPGAEVTLVEDIVSQPEPEEPVEDDSAVNETDT